MRIPGRIPINIHPTFWLFAGMIGYLNGRSLVSTLIWVGIILISVLVHEFGHALMASAFGLKPRIELVALGGLTYHNGQNLSFWKQFLIVLAGPFAGFMLYLGGFVLAQQTMPPWASVLALFAAVNLFWTVINLLPILPLDGGQLLRLVLEKFMGIKGMKWALIISMALGSMGALLFFAANSLLGGAIFALLAFQSYGLFLKTRHLRATDQDETLKSCLQQAEQLLQQGKRSDARTLLNQIRARAKEGVIFHTATQYLASLEHEEGNTRAVYQLLVPIQSVLELESIGLLHQAAFEIGDFPLVAQLAAECYQTWPSVETALRNAYAHAALAESAPAVGWLETAVQGGIENICELVRSKGFDPIRKDPTFQAFLIRLDAR